MIENNLKLIREIGNHPWKKSVVYSDRVKWNKLWTSLDILRESQIAIDKFENVLSETHKDGNLLIVYGFLQAIYLQQDCINTLSESLLQKKIDYKKSHTYLFEIRELRNKLVGHPTNTIRNKEPSFHWILTRSINKDNFEYQSYYPNRGSYYSNNHKVEIREIRTKQGELINKILTALIKELKKEVKEHFQQFDNMKLTDLIPASTNYELGKLHLSIDSNYPLVSMNFEGLYKPYCKVKEELNKRFNSLDFLPGVEHTIGNLDYIFKRVKEKIVDKLVVDDMDSRVYLYALESELKDLFLLLEELDEQYSRK